MHVEPKKCQIPPPVFLEALFLQWHCSETVFSVFPKCVFVDALILYFFWLKKIPILLLRQRVNFCVPKYPQICLDLEGTGRIFWSLSLLIPKEIQK